VKSAIAVLELLRDFYPGNSDPNSSASTIKTQTNVYAPLGDSYLPIGEKEKAIECFKKSCRAKSKRRSGDRDVEEAGDELKTSLST